MAFYTADYIKKLIKEDAKTVVETLKKKDQDLRTYIDNTLPFSLYMDIEDIKRTVVTEDSLFIQEASKIPGVSTETLKDEVIKAYKKVINFYQDNPAYTKITSKELSDKLSQLSAAIDSDNNTIKSTMQSIFKNTLVSSDVSIRDKRLLIISPKFATIASVFGARFKEFFDYSKFSDKMDLETGNTPSKELKKYISTGFSKLQNLGHTEIDIIGTTSSGVKRGLVTPALLAALIDIPKGIKPERLVRKFSRETGQAETRIVVRKRFSGSKLVLEMLIEAGIMIGTVESTKSNAAKAPKERAFQLGKGLKERILKDPSLLTNLSTSKSLNEYIAEVMVSTISGNTIQKYESTSSISEKTPFNITKVSIDTKVNSQKLKQVKLPSLRTVKGRFTSLASLQLLLNSALRLQIQRNMGNGNRKDVLNYRTGRFAESAKVERLSQSREGMITAFYSYMKYPYQTFEPGFRQGSPKSRDPKLLISKSVREIAAIMVGNRLRAIRL